MDLNWKKKGFVFSFLAIFLSFVIFAIAGLYFYTGDYTKDRVFKESRINYLDREIDYFKEVHIKNVIEFSAYNSLVNLLENNKGLILQLEKNYSSFNNLMFESMMHGSLAGVSQSHMNNKTISYFLDSFKEDFKTNFKGDFEYEIKSIKFFEKSPYYLSFLVYSQYNVTTIDNISSWNFKDVREYSIPIFGVLDPNFYIEDQKEYYLRSADIEFDSLNFTLDSFNKTIAGVYSLVYEEPTHKYTIGNSFLNRLLNKTVFGYKDVIGFWSFDYDEDIGRVYDTSLFSSGKFYGNTLIFYDFENKSVDNFEVKDKTGYQINGSLNNTYLIGSDFCVNEECLGLNGVNSSIMIPKDLLNLNFTNDFSLSIWIKTNQTGVKQQIFKYGDLSDELISISLTENLTVNFTLGNHNNGGENSFISPDNVTIDEWNHLVVTYNGSNGKGDIYINGISSFDDIFQNKIYFSINNFLMSGKNISIGSDDNLHFFNGSLDEVNVYSKVLSIDEISSLLSFRKAKLIDYKDSFFGKGVEFDGKDDYLEIDLEQLQQTTNFTVEIWYEPDSNEDLFSRQILMLINETG